MNKLKVKKMIFFFKFDVFSENHPPTRHTKYKRIDIAPFNKPIMANKFRSTDLQQVL